MSIVKKAIDSYTSKMGDLYTGFYYYMLDNKTFSKDGVNNTNVMGYCPSIVSICYNPFISSDDVNLFQIQFDTDRYGNPNNDNTKPNVFRIDNKLLIDKELYTSRVFPNRKPNKDSLFDFRNESKLYFYPYRYLMMADYVNTPLQIKPQLLWSTNLLSVNVKTTISDRCTYNLYVRDLKGDMDGNIEGLINEKSLDIPVGSSAYAQYMATSKAQMQTSVTNQLAQNNLTTKVNSYNNYKSLIGGIGGLSLGGTVNGLLDVTVGENYNLQQSKLNKEEIVSSAMAQVTDIKSTPRAMTSIGNDAIYSFNCNGGLMHILEYSLDDRILEKIGKYFHVYGYRQNRFMIPNTKSRYYYNYIKMGECNIVGNSIPKADLEEIKSIYESGITLWHVFRDGVEVLNYNYDNTEV